ncbi:MAG: hypothetical protein HZA83_03165 [Thaumarchaeota archaeon]|nr:hypothetical protein [Nitrososphaerota archaeon]
MEKMRMKCLMAGMATVFAISSVRHRLDIAPLVSPAYSQERMGVGVSASTMAPRITNAKTAAQALKDMAKKKKEMEGQGYAVNDLDQILDNTGEEFRKQAKKGKKADWSDLQKFHVDIFYERCADIENAKKNAEGMMHDAFGDENIAILRQMPKSPARDSLAQMITRARTAYYRGDYNEAIRISNPQDVEMLNQIIGRWKEYTGLKIGFDALEKDNSPEAQRKKSTPVLIKNSETGEEESVSYGAARNALQAAEREFATITVVDGVLRHAGIRDQIALAEAWMKAELSEETMATAPELTKHKIKMREIRPGPITITRPTMGGVYRASIDGPHHVEKYGGQRLTPDETREYEITYIWYSYKKEKLLDGRTVFMMINHDINSKDKYIAYVDAYGIVHKTESVTVTPHGLKVRDAVGSDGKPITYGRVHILGDSIRFDVASVESLEFIRNCCYAGPDKSIEFFNVDRVALPDSMSGEDNRQRIRLSIYYKPSE